MTPADISPGLRKRQLSPESGKGKAAGSAAGRPTSRLEPTSGRYLALLLCSVAATAFILSRHVAPISPPLSSYVLCAQPGSNIYTVDPAKPTAQCLVVQDGIFVDVGTEGAYPIEFNLQHQMSSGTLQMTSEENGLKVSKII